MKYLRNLLLLSITSIISGDDDLSNFHQSSTSSNMHTTIEKWTMGFEVETSSIKVKYENSRETLVILESLDGKWQLITDTKDKEKDEDGEQGFVNLECRTIGGLDEKEINEYIKLSKHILNQIKVICDSHENGKWSLDLLHINYLWPNLKSGMKINYYNFSKKNRDKYIKIDNSITFMSKKAQKYTDDHLDQKREEARIQTRGDKFSILDLRPQISYSFPINKTKEVFEKVLSRGKLHEIHIMPRFLNTKKKEIKQNHFKSSIDKITTNFINKERIPHNSYVDKKLVDKCNEMQSKSLSGFSLLFTSYVYDLFIMKSLRFHEEVGLKAYLKAMSRVPFSQMYNQLNDNEKEEFRKYFEDNIQESYGTETVQKYRNDNGKTIEDSITLNHWYYSIINPNNNGHNIYDQVENTDLLSPPKDTYKGYAMGAVYISKIGENHALIEARGYNSIIKDEQKIIAEKNKETEAIEILKISYNQEVDNLEEMINKEAGIFFKLSQGENNV